MLSAPAEMLTSSKDPLELAVAAVQIAKGDDPVAHEALRRALQSEAFLQRLDNDEEYDEPRHTLRLASVTKALSENGHVAARETLATLTRSGVFVKEPSRIELLVEATATLRPPPEPVVEFWQKYSKPDDMYRELVVIALLANQSQPAMELFSARMKDEAYRTNVKIGWLRMYLVPRRYDLPILACCGALLEGQLTDELKIAVIEVLFAYRSEWYRPANVRKAPAVAETTRRPREQLRRIAEFALSKMRLPAELRRAVEETHRQLTQGALGGAP